MRTEKTTLLTSFRLIVLLTPVILLLPGRLSAQAVAAEGMRVQEKNYTSFPVRTASGSRQLWEKYNDPSDYDHPEFGYLPDGAPCTECVEVLSKRTVDSRYFVNTQNPSEFFQQTSLGDLNILQNGDYLTLDHRLQPAGNGIFESGFLFEQAGIDAISRRTYIKTTSGTVYFNNWKLFVRSGNTETAVGNADWSNYTVGPDGMLIHNVFPGIDAEIHVLRGALKTNFVIRENQFGNFTELIFRDEYTTPSLASLAFEEHPELSESIGRLIVRSGAQDVLTVGESILFARNGPKSLGQNGIYRISGNKMDVVVPFQWINDNIGTYELVVDPVVTGTATLAQASITGSRYNNSCTFTNSCDYTLAVTRPANATITNTSFTFGYVAAGICWMEDGAMRITAGSCVSPAGAGMYWFCNSIGTGTCSANNQSIFSEVSSCLPPAGCTPQSITFTLKFYRSCYGATGAGCNNSACIGAASPWTMTITGNTLGFTNTATPITLSATTVCQGGSVTASTSGTGGIAPLTYNWSFNASGTPSIGTTPSVTVNFPTSGSITLYSFVTDACGNTVSSSRVVTVTPATTIAVSPSAPAICPGQSVVLTASGASGYTWSPATGLSATTGASVTANPTATTTYTVSGTASGCPATGTATVTVNSNPTITVNPNPATICNGSSVTLNASGASTYSWSPASGLSAATGAAVTANPTATTSYTVTGTSAAGCTGTATVNVTVNSLPVISVNSPSICSGATATLTAAGGVSYSWTPATGLSATSGASVTANPAATTSYTVTGTDANGCTASAVSTVTVNPLPVISVNSPTICSGASATLTASGASSYTWSPAGGLSATTGSTVTANPSATTNYTVTGTDANGCAGSAVSTVTVNPTPTVTASPVSICNGNSATLTASGADTYSWTPVSGLSSGSGATVTANPSTTTTYTITGTTAAGCSSTGTVTVTVNPLPVVAVNSPTICSGSSATLTASGATSYTWSPAGGLSSTTGNTVTTSPTSTSTYTVTGTNANGCTATATSTVTVNPTPVVTANPVSICAGSSASVTASGAATYTWAPVTGLSSGSGATVTANPGTTTTYTITGTTAAGCSGTGTVTVTVNPLPVISVPPATICAGASTPLNASGAATYSWTPSASLSSASGSTVTANPSVTTTYTISGTDANGCISTTTTTVTVNPLPVIAVNSGTICNGSSVALSASGATSYSWSPAAGLSATSGNPVTASPTATATYTVTGTDVNGCVASASSTVTVNSNPVIVVNSPTICAGATATLVAGGAGTSGTYSWSPAAGLSSTSGPSVTTSPTATNSYVVTGTNSNGCSGSATSTITVNPLPVVSASNNGPLCPGEQLLLTSTSTGNPSFSWSGPTSFASPNQNASIAAVNSADAGTYTVTATQNGCSASATTIFSLNPTVPTTITPAGPFCANGSSQLLTAATTGGVWSGPGISDPATGAFDPALAAVGTHTVTYEIPGTCSEPSTLAITVNAIPDASFTATPLKGCPPLDVTFTNTSTSQGNASWDFGDGGSSTALNPEHAYTAAGNFSVQLTMTDANGCSAQSLATDYIQLSEKPQAAFVSNKYETSTLYPTFQFSNKSSGAASYQWEFGDGQSSDLVSPDHTYKEEAGTYAVTLYAYNSAGCVDSVSKTFTVSEEVIFYIPNGFTPNGDEHNNTFQPVFSSGFDPYSFNMLIFNRWGEVVFESNDATQGWDGTYNGTLLSEGAYVWNLRFRSNENGKKYTYSGSFTLMR